MRGRERKIKYILEVKKKCSKCSKCSKTSSLTAIDLSLPGTLTFLSVPQVFHKCSRCSKTFSPCFSEPPSLSPSDVGPRYPAEMMHQFTIGSDLGRLPTGPNSVRTWGVWGADSLQNFGWRGRTRAVLRLHFKSLKARNIAAPMSSCV